MIARVRCGLPLLVACTLLATAACAPSAAPAGSAAPPAASSGAPSGAASSGSGTAPGAGGVATTPAPVAIKVAFSQVAAAFAPVLLAQEQGLFTKYGLDAEVAQLPKPSDIQSLVSGDVQFTVDGSAAVDAIAGGANLVYVAVPLPIYTQGLFGQPGFQKVSDLVGTTIGATSQGGSSDYALRTLLLKEGVDPSQVSISYLRDDAGILAAVETGALQSAILTPPNTLRAREAGLSEIVNTVPLKLRTINNAIIVRRDYAQQHEDVVLNFLRAYMEAIKELKTNTEVGKATVSRFTKLTEPALLDESYGIAASTLMIYPLVHDADVQNVIDMSTTPDVKAHKPADYYDNSYLQKLEEFARGLDPQSVAAAQ
ncbi:MAG TPA: ABC transporter substrate-binding protein [Chloroflexota bacterium]|nr:ABC transporter substrate-binding protein [Chloroflexota bacterium]